MPEAGLPWLPRQELLTNDEIAAVVDVASSVHGIRRFKLTGGEPTTRPGLVELVRKLRAVRGVEELSMTTNGVLLERLAAPLKDAGLDRLTFSLDSLRADRFRRITRNGDIHDVLRAIAAVERAGFRDLKLNVVTMRGINDDEVADFARLTLHLDLTVRFIEYMPLGDAALMHASTEVNESERGPVGGCGAQDRGRDVFVSETEVRTRVERALGPLLPVDRSRESGVGPSVVYRLAHGSPRGRIGFISAMSQPFCDTCNRLRLTADGMLRSCLFEGGEVNLRPILRGGRDGRRRRRRLARAMVDCVRLKPDVHIERGHDQMSRIGG